MRGKKRRESEGEGVLDEAEPLAVERERGRGVENEGDREGESFLWIL